MTTIPCKYEVRSKNISVQFYLECVKNPAILDLNFFINRQICLYHVRPYRALNYIEFIIIWITFLLYMRNCIIGI